MLRKRVGMACAMVLVVLVSPSLFAQEGREASASRSEIATVLYPHDGDTTTVAFPDGRIESVRYIGIDTPEVSDPPSFARYTQPYGKQAKQYNRELVMYMGSDGVWHGRKVRLVRDTRDRDDSGRLLRYVYAIQENGEEIAVNEALLAAGLAKAKEYPPDTAQAVRFAELEREARKARRGRWHSRKKKIALR